VCIDVAPRIVAVGSAEQRVQSLRPERDPAPMDVSLSAPLEQDAHGAVRFIAAP